MLPYIKYNQTNWIDGMKINKDHFIAIENNFLSRYHDSIALGINSFNYGILPNISGKNPFDISIDLDKNGLLRVSVHELRAITNAGVRIEISEKNQQFSQTSFTTEVNAKALNGKDFYIALSVNPYGRVPVGEPDPEEVPPRYPFTDFAYAINLINADELLMPSSGYFHLCIGKVRVSNGQFDTLDDYVPPSASLLSHEILTEYYEHLDKVLTKLEVDCTSIIQKIYSKKQTNTYAVSVLYLTEAVIQYLSATITNYRLFIREQPPIYMIAYFCTLARIMKNTIDLKLGDGREEMLTYFKDWIVEVNQGELDKTLDEMANLQYNHLEIAASFDKLDRFYRTINILFNKLAKLDYIGDKKSKVEVIVKSQDVDMPKTKKKRDLLMDF